tara:strand:+ start:189 stop:692 length:504 start_codon:yes stop_codon:yes gene_type:complete
MIYFVTEAYLKQKTPITQNVSATDVMPFIEPSASSWMQSILGTYFFNDLLVKYNAQTLNGDETILVEKIKPAIAWRATVDCVLGLTYQLKNKGLQKQNGDNSESVDQTETTFVMRHYEQKAEFFEMITRKYLKLNKDLFPEFTSNLNRDSELAPQHDDNFNSDTMFI